MRYVPPGCPLFELTPDICFAIKTEDRAPMLEGLQEAGLLHMPYNELSIRFPMLEASLALDNREIGEPGLYVTVHYKGPLQGFERLKTYPPNDKDPHARGDVMVERGLAMPESLGKYLYFEYPNGNSDVKDFAAFAAKSPGFREDLELFACDVLTTLILSLATRNVIKRTSVNTRAGSDKRPKSQFRGPPGVIYLSRMVVETPPACAMENDADHPPGAAKRPHMRRGHLHTVAFGVGRSERRKQWFPPVFVNADEGYVMAGRKYKLVDRHTRSGSVSPSGA